MLFVQVRYYKELNFAIGSVMKYVWVAHCGCQTKYRVTERQTDVK